MSLLICRRYGCLQRRRLMSFFCRVNFSDEPHWLASRFLVHTFVVNVSSVSILLLKSLTGAFRIELRNEQSTARPWSMRSLITTPTMIITRPYNNWSKLSARTCSISWLNEKPKSKIRSMSLQKGRWHQLNLVSYSPKRPGLRLGLLMSIASLRLHNAQC